MQKLVVLFLSIFFLSAPQAALSPARSYQWAFQGGNLMPNWSFENSLEGWTENPQGGVTVDTRFKAAGSPITSAKTGSFVGMATRAGNGAAAASLLSPIIPIRACSTSYTLSFYYRASSVTGQVRPVVVWHAGLNGAFGTSLNGSNLANQGAWTLYTFPFTVPEIAQSFMLIMTEFATNATGTFYFDDVVVEEGNLTSTQVLANRLRVSETVTFSDALGRALQSQTRITAAGDKYLVTGTGFDSYARPESTYLATPYVISTPTFQTNLLGSSQTYYNSSGPVNTKGYPFSRVRYADELSPRVLESSSPDSAWQFGKGHTLKQGYYFVNTTSIPPNIESPPDSNIECKYGLTWSKNADSNYTLTWANTLGQPIRTAHNVTHTVSGANTWKWAISRTEYYPNGEVQRVLTPLDDSSGGTQFAEISETDAQGNAVSTYSPDRNLKKAWYNRQGQLRYSQDEEQRAAGEYTYVEYDALGRILSEGVQVTGALSQDSVDKDFYNQGTKIEQIGYIYDDTAGFQARTGFTLAELLGAWKGQFDLRNAPGRLFCRYNRNADNTAPKFSAKEKLVADFYNYSVEGLLGWEVKYLGVVKDAKARLQDTWYAYDSLGRRTRLVHYTSASETSGANSEFYHYDFLGRVDTIRGPSSKPLAAYHYAEWGPFDQVKLGGNASGDSAVEVSYAYQPQGGVKIVQSRGKYGGTYRTMFEQDLGYEQKAYNASGVPALLQPKFDGTITQQVYKYTSDMNALKPVRAVNYGYDGLGRMGVAKAYLNTNATPLDGGENIIGGSLTMAAADSLSSAFDYDLNGRIKGQRSAGVSSADSAKYTYLTSSYRLDKVTGKLSAGSARNLSASGNFVYDNNGAMLNDKSKHLNVAYGWDGMPVSFKVDSAMVRGALRCCLTKAGSLPMPFRASYPSLTQYNFYDAGGNRVSRVEVETKGYALKTQSTHYVYMTSGMLKEWHEGYYSGGKVKTSSAIVSVMGQTAQIGRIRQDGKFEFFVKDYLGSTRVTVDDRGGYANGRAQDYLAYGSNRDLKINTADPVTQKFTEKELEQLTGLYAFGARWFDPELGLWMSADPAGQYSNPYSYGSDPINFIDPYGLWSFGLGIVIGYDRHGWHGGFGAAADIDLGIVDVDVNGSHTWSTDGSQTSSLGAGVGIQWGIVGFNVGVNGSYNTMDGYMLNTHIGANIVAVGAEIGSNNAWDANGNYLGGNVYGEGYLGVKGLASIGGGYEQGWGGFRSGFYSNATLMMNSWSDHGNGWGYDGFQQTFMVASYTSKSEKNQATLLTDHSDGIGHSAIVGSYAGQDFHISVGPGQWGVGSSLKGVMRFLMPQLGDTDYPTHQEEGARQTSLRGLNIGKLYQYSKLLQAIGVPYNAATACSFYTSAGILYAGGFSIGGNIHPFAIEKEMQLMEIANKQGY
ncbi:MAG: hypothetical protein JWO30_4677 [Fibrobacteres bacterium]|nr:hypothetical protein [Fibrobacterota bacterium]